MANETDDENEARGLQSTIERAVMTAFKVSDFEASVVHLPHDEQCVAMVALYGKPSISGEGATTLAALRSLYLRVGDAIRARHEATGKALRILAEKPAQQQVPR